MSHRTFYGQQIVTSKPWSGLNLETELADLLSSLSYRLDKQSHRSLSGVKVSLPASLCIEKRVRVRIRDLSMLDL